jgi:hypothetical protein
MNFKKIWKNKQILVKYILICLIMVCIGVIVCIYSNTIKEGLTDPEEIRIINEINSVVPPEKQMILSGEFPKIGFNENEKTLLNRLYSKIGLVSRKPQFANADDSKTFQFLVNLVQYNLEKEINYYRQKYQNALILYNKNKNKYIDVTQLKDNCKILYTKNSEVIYDLQQKYSLNNTDIQTDLSKKYPDLDKLYNSLQKLNNDLNLIINYDIPNNKLILDDAKIQDFIVCVIDLNANLDTTDTDINNYIIYTIEYYNNTLSDYIKKFKEISEIHIKIIKNLLKSVNFSEVYDLKSRVIINGTIANVNQNFNNNYLQPTINHARFVGGTCRGIRNCRVKLKRKGNTYYYER